MIQDLPGDGFLEFGMFGAAHENICLAFEEFFLKSDVQNRIIYLHGLKLAIDEYIDACEYEKAMSE